MGGVYGDSRGLWRLDSVGYPYAEQLSRASSRRTSFKVVWPQNKQYVHSNSVGQHHYSSVYKQTVQPKFSVGSVSPVTLGRSKPTECGITSKVPRRSFEYPCRRTVQDYIALRMEIESAYLCKVRQAVGSSHHRQVRFLDDGSTSPVQQFIPRPQLSRSRLSRSTRLVTSQQFCESAFLDATTTVRSDSTSKSGRHIDSATLASTAVDADNFNNVDRLAGPNPKHKQDYSGFPDNTRAPQKSSVADVRLADIWSSKLKSRGWSVRVQQQLPFFWAKSTLELYDRLVNKLKSFCEQISSVFPPEDPGVIAEFLVSICDTTTRPRSQLVSVSAALGCLYNGLGLTNIMDDGDLRKFLTALIKSGTSVPRNRSSVMPVAPFHALFMSWLDNEQLTIKDLRLKVVTLLSLVAMLRPSDIAPKAQYFNPVLAIGETFTFNVDQLHFSDDGSLSVVFYGIKNDYVRDGYRIHVPPSSLAKLDPVQALRVYISRTNGCRPQGGPVFLTLSRPYKAISSSTVSKILNNAISLAGLPRTYTAKCFRPTGATNAIEAGLNPDSVRKLGRWKSQPVFEEHYVHAKPSSVFTDKVLCL